MAQTQPGRSRLAALFGGSTFASLENGQFRLLLSGTALSQIANWMEEVARGWLILELTDSAFQLGLFGFIRGISQLVMSPFAGVLADRLDRRRLAAITQIVPAIDAGIIAILVATGEIQTWHLYPLVCISGLVGAVNVPTRQVLVYDVVGGQSIANAIALNSVVANMARIVAPAVGGILIGTTGIAASYVAQVVFFLLATGATLLLRPQVHAEPERTPMWQSLREGISYARGDPVVSRLVLLNVIPNLLIYPYIGLMPLFAKDVLGAGSAGYGILLTGAGFGSIPGGLIVAGMSEKRSKGRAMALAALLYTAMVFLFAVSAIFVVSFGILIVAGVGWSMFVTLNQTLLQLHVADAYRGRMMSLYSMASGVTPFGSLGMGTAADQWGVQTAVAAFALTAFCCAAVLGIGSKRVREL